MHDEGSGLSDEEGQAVMEGRSAGLGLMICRRIVEGHGGKLFFSSVPDKGTTFGFSLPRKLQGGEILE